MIVAAPISSVSREGDLRPLGKGKTLLAYARDLKPGAVHAVYENSDHARLGEGGFGAFRLGRVRGFATEIVPVRALQTRSHEHARSRKINHDGFHVLCEENL